MWGLQFKPLWQYLPYLTAPDHEIYELQFEELAYVSDACAWSYKQKKNTLEGTSIRMGPFEYLVFWEVHQ